MDTVQTVRNIYDAIKHLPSEYKKSLRQVYSVTDNVDLGNYPGKLHRTLITTKLKGLGIAGRTSLWRNKVQPIFDALLELPDITKGEDLDHKFANHVFRSRMFIYDVTNDVRLDVWCPPFSSVLSPFIGTWLRAELREPYFKPIQSP